MGNMIKKSPHYTSELDGPIREVHRALRGILPPTAMTAGDDEFLAHVVDDLDWLYSLANEAIIAERGPRMTWPGTITDEEDFPSLIVMTVDMDEGTLSDPAGADCLTRWSSDNVDWKDTAPAQAALAYKRETRWDTPPDQAGVWIIAASPYGLNGGTFRGNLVGFAVFHDRDDDGEYESLAHIWTAAAWRRRGIGGRLIRAARDLMPITSVEEPITSNGQALLGSVARDLLQTE
ncbi:hypothetical protein NBCG_02945 [Nocardioidaceae bacterium Broad-1]|nr:hypothetical protein NBCG_02945 [Nocardioidaceae bacterium Broad-1]